MMFAAFSCKLNLGCRSGAGGHLCTCAFLCMCLCKSFLVCHCRLCKLCCLFHEFSMVGSHAVIMFTMWVLILQEPRRLKFSFGDVSYSSNGVPLAQNFWSCLKRTIEFRLRTKEALCPSSGSCDSNIPCAWREEQQPVRPGEQCCESGTTVVLSHRSFKRRSFAAQAQSQMVQPGQAQGAWTSFEHWELCFDGAALLSSIASESSIARW